MILKKSLMVAGALGAVALMAVAGGCSSSPKVLDEGGVDSGTGGDGAAKDSGKDSGGGDGSMGGMCPTPLDVSGYNPETLPDAVGKHTAKCTQMQLDLYHKCVGQPQDMAACMQIQQLAMTTFKDCLGCLETTITDAKWGPLVCTDPPTCMANYLNVEGCVNLATGQSGMSSCGQLLHSSYGCQRAACEMQCSGDSQGFSKCVQTALAGGCKKYNDAFSAMCMNISSDPDGGYPDLDNCFRRQGETDSLALRVRMDTFFCGP
jgi:hypothetical protein